MWTVGSKNAGIAFAHGTCFIKYQISLKATKNANLYVNNKSKKARFMMYVWHIINGVLLWKIAINVHKRIF